MDATRQQHFIRFCIQLDNVEKEWNLLELKNTAATIHQSMKMIIRQYQQQTDTIIVPELTYKKTLDAVQIYEKFVHPQLQKYAQVLSASFDIISQNLIDIKKFCCEDNFALVNQQEKNPIQHCYYSVQELQANKHVESLVHSLSCAYYTLFGEYLDQFNYFLEEVNFADTSEDEDANQEEPRKSTEIKKNKSIIKYITELFPHVTSVCWILYGFYYTYKVSRRKMRSTRATVSYTENSRLHVIDLLAEMYKLYLLAKTFLWTGGVPAVLNFFFFRNYGYFYEKISSFWNCKNKETSKNHIQPIVRSKQHLDVHFEKVSKDLLRGLFEWMTYFENSHKFGEKSFYIFEESIISSEKIK